MHRGFDFLSEHSSACVTSDQIVPQHGDSLHWTARAAATPSWRLGPKLQF